MVVFLPELRVLQVPADGTVIPIGPKLPLETLLQKVRQSRPDDSLVRFGSAHERDSFEDFPNKALNFFTRSRQGDLIHTFINPYTGAILFQDRNHRFLQEVYELHSDLLAGKPGRFVNAWFAVVLMMTSLAGLLLWWRGRKYWRVGVRYRPRAGWRTQSWDLHSLGGFLFSLPLLILALTGTYFSYERGFTAVAAVLTRSPNDGGTGWPSGGIYYEPRAAGGEAIEWRRLAVPKASLYPAKWQALDDIVHRAERQLPDCKVTTTSFPVANGTFSVRFHCPAEPYRSGLTFVYVDPPTARVVGIDRFSQSPLAVRLIRLTSPIHFGDIGGLSTRLFWVAIGLSPAGLFVTSLLMWWNRSLSNLAD